MNFYCICREIEDVRKIKITKLYLKDYYISSFNEKEILEKLYFRGIRIIPNYIVKKNPKLLIFF